MEKEVFGRRFSDMEMEAFSHDVIQTWTQTGMIGGPARYP